MSNEVETRSPEELALLAAAASVEETAPVETVQVMAPEITVPVEPERKYEYQPKDENGRPIGGKQVIKYRTPEELADKLRDQNELLIRKLRIETRNNRLGIHTEEEIGKEAPRFQEPVSFGPRTLTKEEQYRIAQEISDPETFERGADALLEARLGQKPEVLAKTIADLQAESIRNRAVAESEAFMEAHPEYVRVPENGKAITAWLVRYNLAPVLENYENAYAALRRAGVLIEASDPSVEPVEPAPVEPAATPEPPQPQTVVPEPVAASAPAPSRQVSRVPTGLTRAQSSDAGTTRTVGDDIVYEVVLPQGGKKVFTGIHALNAMPADEYKRRISQERGFREKAEKLEAAQAAKRQYVQRV